MSTQYFAQIDDNNVVTYVAVVTREFLEANPERYPGRWVETFYHTEGKNTAGVGAVYDEASQNFILSQPFPSWTLDENSDWQPPVARPEEGLWAWNEETLAWVEVDVPE